MADQAAETWRGDLIVNEIMEIYGESEIIHEQALVAIGKHSRATHNTVASTKGAMNLTPDLKLRDESW